MALVERPDPRRKLIIAAGLDFLIVALGVAMFVASGSMLWILMAVAFGAAVKGVAVRSGRAVDLVGTHGQTVWHHDGAESSGLVPHR